MGQAKTFIILLDIIPPGLPRQSPPSGSINLPRWLDPTSATIHQTNPKHTAAATKQSTVLNYEYYILDRQTDRQTDRQVEVNSQSQKVWHQ